MPYIVSKVEMWTGQIEDRVGGLSAKLAALADAGVDLEIVVARRQGHLPESPHCRETDPVISFTRVQPHLAP
jgi:hypothetical protein